MTEELTKPTLYSIYNSSEIMKENDMNELYSSLSENILKSEDLIEKEVSSSVKHQMKKSTFTKFFSTLFKLLILGVLGNLYHLLSLNIHDNHILYPELASKPLNFGVMITNFLLFKKIKIPNNIIYAIEGIAFGIILPIFDNFIFTPCAGTKDSKKNTSALSLLNIDTSSIIRSVIAFLGISFALRKIEWSSSFQASVTWLLLNPTLWILLDGTISGFLLGVVIATMAAASFIVFDSGLPTYWYQNDEFWAVLIWLGNFFFFGLVVFGKVGRYLFD